MAKAQTAKNASFSDAAKNVSFSGRRRIRKFFGHITEAAEMPNLIEVQKSSYDQFLMVDKPVGGRGDEGLQAVFRSVFPIRDFAGTAQLDFVDYEFEPPKFDVDECRQRDITFAAPLKVTLRLIVFDVDPDTGARSVKDIKEQDVYMGDMPLMTDNGTFIVERHRARHRLADAPIAGRVLRPRQGQDPFVGQAAVRRPHHPVSRLLARHRVRRQGHRATRASTGSERSRSTSLLYALGLDGEEILNTFYKPVIYTADKDGWRVPFGRRSA
jgi:DNA-directed RNA polymerase subunit beta